MSGKASVRQKATREVIDIADKLAWTKLVSSDDDYNFDVNGLGFIGKGSTKCAIYVRLESVTNTVTNILNNRLVSSTRNMPSHFLST